MKFFDMNQIQTRLSDYPDSKVEKTIPPNFKTLKIYIHQERVKLAKRKIQKSTQQRPNTTKGPKIDPREYSQLIFDKNAKLLNGDKAVFSTNGDATTGNSYAKK